MLRHALPSYVSKILNDARPADLPLEEFTHFELVINLRRRRSPSASQPPRSPAPTRESNFCKRTLLQVLTPAFGTWQASTAMQQVSSVGEGAADQKIMFDHGSPRVRD